MIIDITLEEEKMVEGWAVKSRTSALMYGHKNNVSRDFLGNGREQIVGYKAEYVTAKALGLEWKPRVYDENYYKTRFEDRERLPDLDHNIEVRTSEHPAGNLLTYFPTKDSIDWNYVLTLPLAPRKYEVIGWIPGDLAKKLGKPFTADGSVQRVMRDKLLSPKSLVTLVEGYKKLGKKP
jgi:hypothetical protein